MMPLATVEKTLQQLLPLQAITLTIQFKQPVTFRFFHETSLSAFIRTLYKIDPTSLKENLRIEALESGRVHYQTGDKYRFRLYALSGNQNLLQHLIQAIYQASHQTLKESQGKPLYPGGYSLIEIHDGLNGNPINSHTELEQYTYHSLQEDAQLLAHAPTCNLKFQSACQLTHTSGKTYCRNFHDLKQHNLLKRLLESLWRSLRPDAQKHFSVSQLHQQQHIPPYPLHSGHLVWFDIPYGPAKSHKRIDGLLGQIKLRQPPITDNLIWQKILLLGQYLGLGNNINEGQGRYLITIDTPKGKAAIHYKPLPANSLLDRALTTANLHQAIEHTCRKPHDRPYIPDIKQTILKHRKRIRQDRYTPAPLTPIEQKKDGKLRLLKVAPLDDRSLQRAIQQTLNTSLASLQHDQSFGYRLGLSRHHAQTHISSKIRRLKRQGKQAWVLRADIHQFFDEIDHRVARERLEMLYQDDPIIPHIMAWMAAPVEGWPPPIEAKGLPQGSPISPILANLILDDFDNDMQHAGYDCIRFADDFIVITDSEEKAQQAWHAAEQSLAEHHLTLHPDKTHIRNTQEGFHYLGYTFINDMAVDTPTRSNTPFHLPQAATADVPALTVKPDTQPDLSRTGEQPPIGQTLIVSGDPCLIRIQQNQLCIERDETRIAESPLGQLHHLLLFGQHHLTYPAQKTLLENQINVHYSRAGGTYLGTLQAGSPTLAQLHYWHKQHTLFANEQNTLPLAKQLIAAKIAHSREVLRRYNQRQTLGQLGRLIHKLHTQANSNRDIMRYEAQAATLYNQALRTQRPLDPHYTHRHKQGAQDLFNILLNLGYAQLRGYTTSFISASGLAPSVGLLHKARGRHMALSSDLMEPFRYIVERVATTLLKRNIINQSHLEKHRGQNRLNAEGRRKFYTALSKQLETKRQPASGGRSQSLLQHMSSQSQSLANWVHNPNTPFQEWRMR